ncbi:PepSY-associated TM helix domain-containing protein [Methylomonas methanica]|uniref:PepSY-associated TM helix domain protein n=1 Tax=Methylomonas methanica (strain DSM 25384 / MC09) TaxID=857087 RepID=G0A7H7_METMM|nr:PepSY-associated TM helix domain-containing protein [Methylomonas methanica]AEG00647.1 PepSY-associated TM helix domain protein [Methylomonas methanica MC09]
MPPRFRFCLTRTLWLKCHLYLALLFGLFFALMGLTGSLSVYRAEIDALLNPELLIEQPQSQPVSLDIVIAQLRKHHPNRHGAWTLEMPNTPNGTITAWFEKPAESVDSYYAPLMVAVNPYTGKVIGSRFWGHTFTTWLLDLHTHLQLGASGRNIVTALAVLLMISVCSGLYLWWPGLARLSQAFKLRHDAGLMRLLLDTHRLLGLLSAGFLLLLAFTGFHLAYPDLLENLTASSGMGHGDAGPNVSSTSKPNDKPITLSEAVLVARGLFPSSEVRRVTTPAGELGTYRINLRQHRELNQHHPFTNVWVDRWSGQIRGVNNPILFSAGQTFTTWQWPIHTGEAFGDWGRLIWFFTGLMPLALWLSGLLHWLHRQGVVQDRSVDISGLGRTATKKLAAYSYRTHGWLMQKLEPLVILAIRKAAETLDRYKK